MKKSNNKGFSLVELIVVVAIMAVLVGVLAPAYLSYVEKSRAQKDDSAIAEIAEVAQVAMAEEAVFNAVTPGTTTIVVTVDATTGVGTITTTSDDSSALLNAIKAGIGSDTVKMEAKAHKGHTVTISTTASGQTSIGNWS